MRSTASRSILNFARSFSSKAQKTEPTPGTKALHEIDALMAKGDYKDAYTKLEEANKKFPGLYKAVPFYRGEILEALSEQRKAQGHIKSDKPQNNNSAELK